MNRWDIPDSLEREIIERDRQCVYCGVEFDGQSANRRDRPSWEHIINDARIITRENIARCCIGCNASKGTKALAQWLHSRYCARRGITSDSVALVVQAALNAKPHVQPAHRLTDSAKLPSVQNQQSDGGTGSRRGKLCNTQNSLNV
jgi:hypothetical protein